MTGKIAASDNVMSMLNYSDTCISACFYGLFKDCTSLTVAPELPATILADYCYDSMFNGCKNLVNAPELPATTLCNYCYSYMFAGCTNLTEAPKLPATTLGNRCYYGLFENNTKLTIAPELPATKLADSCYENMFKNCTNLTSAPKLPATTLASKCYYCMFYGCTSLVNAPELPATYLVNSCYSWMFYNCKKLNYIKVAFKTWGGNTSSWVNGVSSTGTFVAPRELPIEFGNDRIPKGWQLPNHQYIIYPANDTFYFNSKLNIQATTKIDILFLQPDNLQPTFRVSQGSLPDGLTLDENTGVISGSCEEEFMGDIKITISAAGCEDKIVTLSIFISDALQTVNNLTSNDSNPDYEVSQSSDNNSSNQAWKAMDNSTSSNSRTTFDSGKDGWWQIKFTEGPVVLKKIEGTIKVYNNNRPVTLRGSNDGEIFEDILTFTTGDNVSVIINQDTPYQYYRIYNAKSDYYLSITDIKFYYVFTEDYLGAKDQNFNWKLNEYKEHQIEYINFGGGLYFEILEGNLPEGITFDENSGTFSGSSDVEFNENLVIQIDNGVNFITINVGLKCTAIPSQFDLDGLTLYMPFTTSVTEPKIGETFVSDSLPVLDVVDGEVCTTFNPGQYLYNDSNNYWSVYDKGSNLTMVFDIYIPSTISTEQRQPRFIVAGSDPTGSMSYAELAYCYRKSDSKIRNII